VPALRFEMRELRAGAASAGPSLGCSYATWLAHWSAAPQTTEPQPEPGNHDQVRQLGPDAGQGADQ
jgi:hypothetical protein